MRYVFVGLLFLAACWTVWLSASPIRAADSSGPSAASTCEYKVLWNEPDAAALNMQGSDGWRLVAVGASGKIAGAEFFERCHN